MPSTGFALRNRRHLPRVYAVLVSLAIAVISTAIANVVVDVAGDPHAVSKSLERIHALALTCVTGLAALLFFLYQQHREETRLFIDLFSGFNARYDRLNARLNQIVDRVRRNPDAEFWPDEEACLDDYFNLCAEEYLFARSGYLDPDVWQAWRAGMRYYGKVPAIRRRWQDQLRQGSYDGFALSLLDDD